MSVIYTVYPSEGNLYLNVKFEMTPDVVRSFLTDNFSLWTTGATPTEIAEPFYEVDLYNDYESISRHLTLKLRAIIEPETSYELRVENFYSATGSLAQEDSYEFVSSVTSDPIVEPTPDVIHVVDHSIKTTSLVEEDVNFFLDPVDSSFYVVSSDPENGEVYLADDYNDGRMTIKFNAQPDLSFVNEDYFIGQRKTLVRGPARWENLPVQVTPDDERPWVYVDFPSLDATPVYHQSGAQYYETNYQYRVKILQEVRT